MGEVTPGVDGSDGPNDIWEPRQRGGEGTPETESALRQGEQIVRSVVGAVGAALAALILLAGFSVYSEYSVYLKDAERRVESAIAASEQNIKLAVASVESVMRAIIDRVRTVGLDSANLNRFLFALDYNLPATSAFIVVSPQGIVVAESRPERLSVGQDVSQRAYFQVHLKGGDGPNVGSGDGGDRLFIGPPVRNSDTSWMMPVSRAVRDEQGNLLAVVMASIDLRYIAKVFSSMDAGPHKLVVLMHREGMILSSFPFDFNAIGRSIAETPLFRQYLPVNQADVIYAGSALEGGDRIVAYRHLAPLPLVLEVSMRRDDALGHFTEVAGGWAALLALFVAATLFATRRQIDQTRRLAKQSVLIHQQMSALRRANESLYREMSERRAAEAERDRLFNLSLDMLIIASLDGWFRRVNPAVVATLGYSEPELLAVRMIDIVHPDDVEGTLGQFRALGLNQPVRNFENRFRRKDGRFRWFSWNAIARDQVVYAVARDVSEQKVVAAQLEQALFHAESANRAKSDFLANMSHELRTPLNGVIGYAEALSLGIFGALTTKQVEYVDNIRAAGGILLGIVNDLLDLSVVEAGRMVMHESESNLGAVVTATLTLAQERADTKRIRLGSDLPERAPVLWCDELKLKQVLVNLLINAIKFTPEGGSVRIVVPPPTHSAVVIDVVDTGIGIAPQDMQKVMTPFGQVEPVMARKQGGVGLGLPLARRLIELHGGHLTLISTVGKGTTARITLPNKRLRQR